MQDALLHRQVRIFQPTKSTMQSAKGKTKRWVLDWDVLSSAGRWENPLIGWASSADYMQGTNVFFRTKEDAIAFVSTTGSFRSGCVGCMEKLTLQAEKQGWDYYVQTPHKPKIPPKNYGTVCPRSSRASTDLQRATTSTSRASCVSTTPNRSAIRLDASRFPPD